MTNQDDMIKLIKSISGQANVLTIPRVYIGFTKSHRAALFLSQCVYWSDRSRLPDGWFYKSFREWHDELGLNQHAVETCVKTLKAGEWLHTKIETVATSPTTFYRADLDKIATSIRLYLAEHHIAETYIADSAKYDEEHLAENAKLIKRKTISPSIKQKLSSETTEGISHPDFDAACSILEASDPFGFLSASPVLMEVDEHPNRMRVKLSSVPAGFMDAFKTALEQVTRRRYAVSFETPGTGRVVAPKIDADPPAEAADMPSLFGGPISAADLELWQTIMCELSAGIRKETYLAYIAPARPISVNGDWTIAVPSVTWWRMHMPSALKRIYKGLTGQETTFIFQEDHR